MKEKDSYATIATATEEILFKEKNSKFYGYAFPVQTEEEVKTAIESLKKRHPKANHFCYAYQIGTTSYSYRVNDDGEPNNSAGMPIYGQIQSFELTNVLVVVARIFGGTKLGVGGLITAYKKTAQLTLENAVRVEKTIDVQYSLTYDYQNTNKVMRIIKEKKLEMVSQEMETNQESGMPFGKIELKIPKKNAEQIFDIFNSIYGIAIQVIS